MRKIGTIVVTAVAVVAFAAGRFSSTIRPIGGDNIEHACAEYMKARTALCRPSANLKPSTVPINSRSTRRSIGTSSALMPTWRGWRPTRTMPRMFGTAMIARARWQRCGDDPSPPDMASGGDQRGLPVLRDA